MSAAADRASRLSTRDASVAVLFFDREVVLEQDNVGEPVDADETRDAGFCVAMIDDEGERTFITSPAPKDHFDTQTCCRSMYGVVTTCCCPVTT